MSKENHIKKWLDNGLYTLLPDVGLLQEFAEYGNNLKAERVYKKCVLNQKFELAEKIKLKKWIERNIAIEGK